MVTELLAGPQPQLVALGSTAQLQTWVWDNIIPLVILVVSAGIAFKAGKKDHRGAVQVVGIILVGLFVAGMAIGDNAQVVAKALVKTGVAVLSG